MYTPRDHHVAPVAHEQHGAAMRGAFHACDTMNRAGLGVQDLSKHLPGARLVASRQCLDEGRRQRADAVRRRPVSRNWSSQDMNSGSS
jgi:hypothetical protein